MGEGEQKCEFHGPCAPGAGVGEGQKLPKIYQFSKIFSTTAQVEEKLNAW
jgi:hypothetical protein